MHAYRSHTCGALRASDAGSAVRLSGWVHQEARPRRPLVHRPARPLRPDAAGAAPRDAGLRRRRAPARRERHQGGRRGRGPRRLGGEPEPADRRDRGPRPGRRGPVRGRRTADAGLWRSGVSRGHPSGQPLPGPAPRASAQEHRPALARDLLDPPAHGRPGLSGISDPHPDGLVAGRGARLPGAVAAASGQVLCAAPGAAAVQTAADGLGLRPLFPDRALLPRRGPARRPFAGVLSAGRRDELRDPGRRLRRHRTADARRVRGVRRGQAGVAHRPAARLHQRLRRDVRAQGLRAPDLRPVDGLVRFGQAGPAQPDQDAGGVRPFPRRRLRPVRQDSGRGRQERRLGHPGADRRQRAPSATV